MTHYYLCHDCGLPIAYVSNPAEPGPDQTHTDDRCRTCEEQTCCDCGERLALPHDEVCAPCEAERKARELEAYISELERRADGDY